MGQISMKIEPSTDTDFNNGSLLVDQKPEYPPGLQISLRNEELKKLGIDALPQIEERVVITAVAEVIEVRTDRDNSKHVRLQIQTMSLEKRPGLAKTTAETLYGPTHK